MFFLPCVLASMADCSSIEWGDLIKLDVEAFFGLNDDVMRRAARGKVPKILSQQPSQ